MKPWEKYAEAEAKPWEKYATAPLSVKADTIGEQTNKDYDALLGRIGVIDRGATFGLGRKAVGLVNAAGSYIADAGYRAGEVVANIKNKGLKGAFDDMEQLPSFWDRYHSVVDPTMQAMERYQEEHPVESFALELGAGMFNPANKVGAGWIGKGGNAVTRTLRSGAVGSAAGGVAGAMNTENVEKLRDNTIVGSVFGFGLGVTLPAAIGMITKGIGMMRNNTKKGLDYMRRELGDEVVDAMIKEAEETGRPIIEVANEKALKLGQAARMQTPEAMDAFEASAERFKNTMSDRNAAFIDENLGTLNRFDSIEALEDDARQQARPLYEKFYQRKDLANTDGVPIATRYSGGDDIAIAKSIRRNMEKNNQDFRMGIDKNGNIDYPHFVRDSQRAEYLKTFPSTYKYPDDAFFAPNKDGVIQEYLQRQYYNPERNLKMYDNIVRTPDGVTISKIAREGEKGRKYAGKLKGLSSQASETALGQGQTRSALSPELQVDNSVSPLGKYVKENPFLQQEIGKIRKNPLFQTEYNMSELPDTDARILDQLNKNINDQIATAVRNGENETVRLLERQKYGLLNMVDDAAPEFKEARALYEDARRFKKAANTAEQIFKGDISKEAFAKTFDDMSKTEREALKIGLRDEIYKIIGNRENEALGWKKVVPAQVQDKIRKVLGKEEGNKLIKYANDEIKAMRNHNKINQGSKTSEKDDLKKVINWKGELMDLASLGYVSGRNKGIANIMTNPNAGEVASAFEQLSNPRWGEAVYQRYLGYTPEMIALGNYLANKR